MTDWIEINLPWSAETPSCPDKLLRKFRVTDAETRKAHGMTKEEALQAYEDSGGKDEYVWKLTDSLEPEFKRLGIYDWEHKAERWRVTHETWRKRRGQKAIADAWYKWKTIVLWEYDHPKTYGWAEVHDKWMAEHKPKSFTGQGLNKPGTWIKLATGAVYLIGHINTNRGVCDDCTEFGGDETIVAYKPPTEETPGT